MTQKFQSERLYINTILKLSYYFHALSRFDKSAEERIRDNLIILFADEGQEILTGCDQASLEGGERAQWGEWGGKGFGEWRRLED